MKSQVVTQPRWYRQPPRGERSHVRRHGREQLSPGGARLVIAPGIAGDDLFIVDYVRDELLARGHDLGLLAS